MTPEQREEMRRRFENMTPEEREQMRQTRQGRQGGQEASEESGRRGRNLRETSNKMESSAPKATGNHEIIRLENARKIYAMGQQEVRALAGVNNTFAKGSFWAIMGPSGSGKSTMMNILGCLDRLSSGRYFFDGRDISTLDDDSLSELRLRQIGFIFQSFNLIPQLTVQKNIELPLYYLGWETERSASWARQLAEQVGLGDRLGHRPTELSGGQMQRVAIAGPWLMIAGDLRG